MATQPMGGWQKVTFNGNKREAFVIVHHRGISVSFQDEGPDRNGVDLDYQEGDFYKPFLSQSEAVAFLKANWPNPESDLWVKMISTQSEGKFLPVGQAPKLREKGGPFANMFGDINDEFATP